MGAYPSSVAVVTPPAPFVTLTLAKQHLRVDSSDKDGLIEVYIAAACAHIDGPQTWLGRAIGTQTLRATFDAFDCDLLRLPGSSLLTIASVIYDDSDGVAQTLDGAMYSLSAEGALLAYGETWPTPQDRAGAIRIQYTAGYATVPPAIVAAALLMIGDLHETGSSWIEGQASAVPMSTTVEALLNPFRVPTL